jgi:hypothetical protein
MTTNPKVEFYKVAKVYYPWLANDLELKLKVIHAFKSNISLERENIKQISKLINQETNFCIGPCNFFTLIVHKLINGSKVARFKGIWKSDEFKNEFSVFPKVELEYAEDENYYNLGVSILPFSRIDIGLHTLISHQQWSFLVFNSTSEISINALENIYEDLILIKDHFEAYNYIAEHVIKRGACLIRFGDGGEDWEISLAYR